jgi:hypothetical protein
VRALLDAAPTRCAAGAVAVGCRTRRVYCPFPGGRGVPRGFGGFSHLFGLSASGLFGEVFDELHPFNSRERTTGLEPATLTLASGQNSEPCP